MIINIACFGYFGHFLAREMYTLGRLGKCYTNLTANRAYGIGKSHLRTYPLLAAPYALNRLGCPQLAARLNWPCIEAFDKWVAKQLTPCDVFHCFSSFGLRAHRMARERFGAMTVVERGSSHIRFQDEILRDEHARWGLTFRGIDNRIVEKEEMEYSECDYITVQSRFAERTFEKAGVERAKLIKLPLGVDLGMFRPVKKSDLKFRILYAGTMSIRKGVLYLLQALRGLEIPNWEFVFNGHVDDTIKPLVEPYNDLITYVGTRRFDDLYALYSQASVFVLPTIEDGFAKVITEAMACGVPVIATTNCGAEDVISDGVDGFIVPIRDPEAIRRKITYLYENPDLREEMAAAALRKAATSLSVETHGARALQAYRSAFEAL